MISMPIKASGGSAQASKPAMEICGRDSGIVAASRFAEPPEAATFAAGELVPKSADVVRFISSFPSQ